MTIDEFLAQIDDKLPPAPAEELAAFERAIGHPLPDDYRQFLVACNGGYVGRQLWFQGPTPGAGTVKVGVHHVGGFRKEWHFSLPEHRTADDEDRRPSALVWVMDDPFGNDLCIGVSGPHVGRMFFCHREYDLVDSWESSIDSSSSGLFVLADSLTNFIAHVRPLEPDA